METAHSGFVQPRSTPKRPIYEEESPVETVQPAADSSLIYNLYSEEFDTIETNIAENEPECDVNATNRMLDIPNTHEETTTRTKHYLQFIP